MLARCAVFALLLTLSGVGTAQEDVPDIAMVFAAASIDEEIADAARQVLAAGWRDAYAAMFVDLLDLLQRTGFVDPRGFVQLARLTQFLEAQTGQSFGSDLVAWRRWVWSLPYDPHPDYGEFKGLLYARLDSRFADFFQPQVQSSIRLDEIQWGGVAVNGIPPLDHPSMIAAADADYLEDDNIVFGFVVGGDARAYPKRILAWHELALDRVGDREITIVYCTLCGTVIPFDSEVGGEVRRFGTSGLLYQSNKLMFDEGTKSLWSSLLGEPVVGPLVGSGFVLTALPVVTTTWGEWRRRHPETLVLSLATGFQRDYSEGAAYRAYFGTDALMFDVSRLDGRLANKAEVLVLRGDASAEAEVEAADASETRPLAISTRFLAEHPVYHFVRDGLELVVLTDASGANRVYRTDGVVFERLSGDRILIDAGQRRWRIGEDALVAEFDPALSLGRVSAHRAFWFGWYAQYPETLLVD